ncbi:SRPBCC family protein [Roseofilum casamattae]|uniref:SRPBCC family protein n=1 Tax=Roseofilum casamattae BLCC-M143 TaxID=3022442 RepID=A0ABT7C172_9CYAN|nr:SRPBCC family protein [Roseofilum casamattae]MDJ1184807.1 SRPBCC family protein [Roseofilum casamattae BLCC-M143]
MQIHSRVTIAIESEIETVFDASIDCETLARCFTGYKAIAAVINIKTADGLPVREGSTRIVDNSNGMCIEEVILSLKRPNSYEYQLLKGFKPPFSWLIRTASAKWSYETLDTKTKVTWDYYFEPLNSLASLVFRALVQRQFQQALEICLQNLKQSVEE